MTHSAYVAMADLEVAPVRQSPFMGVSNTQVISLRCFQRYSRDATTDIIDPWGKTRWLSPKQARIYAILDRDSSNGGRVLKMKDIASEAMASISTVSRTVVKLQAFGLFAIDVIRGRHGGISVRKRRIGDNLRRYAECAWAKIRARINVASAISRKGKAENEVRSTYYVSKDATFTEDQRIERDGARLLAGEIDLDEATQGRRRLTEADREHARAVEWANQVIAERRRLDEHEPDWDLYLEKVRASHGMN